MLAITLQAAVASPRRKDSPLQARLDNISRRCRTPREWLTARGAEVVVSASPDADFEKLSCVLKRVSAILPPVTLGFIGNEQVSEKK